MPTSVGMKVGRTARKIVIELPLSVLPTALHASPLNMDPDGDPAYHVTNKAAFADAIVEALGSEEDDGTTPLHRLFDAAMLAAIEDGCEGVEEYRRSIKRRERDRGGASRRSTCGAEAARLRAGWAMSDLAQWIAYQRRAAVFGTSEETVLALLDVAEQAAERSAAEGAYAVEGDGGGPAAWRLFRAKTALDAAIARLAEVKP